MALLGLSGYIGSGKDTVGRIIQYLEDRERGFSNKKWDKFEEWNKDVDFQQAEEWSGWEIKKFAFKMKQIASILTGIEVEKFEDQEFKEKELGEEWRVNYSGDYDIIEAKDFNESSFSELLTPRKLLQLLGTESIRDNLHPNTWVNALFADYKKPPEWDNTGWIDWNNIKGDYPNWIITDVRFPNEAQAIKQRGGIIVRIDRNILKIGEKEVYIEPNPINLHSSETALDDWEFDYFIDNNSSIDSLVEKVKNMLNELKIS